MKQHLFIVISLLAVVAVALGNVAAPAYASPEAQTWQAAYWNNMTLTGTPVLQRSETEVNYNWGAGSPGSGVQNDGFSARWTTYIQAEAAGYRFTATSDDGLRVKLDGAVIIDQWYDHTPVTVSVDRALTSGSHLLVVEFYERGGEAVAKVSWAPTSATFVEWRGEYYNNIALSGNPALVRNDAAINFNWGTGAPDANVIPADNFSVRWTRSLDLPAGWYTFSVTSDDGVRLRVNELQLVDKWQEQPEVTHTARIYLPGGPVPVRLEYFEKGGQAVARLSWAADSAPPAVDAVIVDVTSAGFEKGGDPQGWRSAAQGYGNDLLWTKNNDWARPSYNWARWRPSLQARDYEVLVYIPSKFANTANARYWVGHAGGYTLRAVDQSAYSNEWVSLGTYHFRGTSEDRVMLQDVTGETRMSRFVAFDAIKWVPR